MQKLINQPSDLPQNGCPDHRVGMLRSQIIDVAIQTTTYLDYERVCPGTEIVADKSVHRRTSLRFILEQLHYTHRMNILLLGMSRLIDVT